MTELLKTLTARGLVQDATAGLADRLGKGPITAYVGFDPTADSLHVGNLVPIMGAAWLQKLGHTPIVVIGGGTGMVGDPSGKREERPILSVEKIDRNAAALRSQLKLFLDFEGPGGGSARFCNNANWLRNLLLMEFLRDAGKYLTTGFMNQKESVRSRVKTGMSYAEYTYMVVQAYDFLHLFLNEGCELQIGGSDQWGNITAGIELIRKREGKQAYGLTFPLIENASGAKFGKSEVGNVWLDPAKTDHFHFYQFWINTDDRDVERYLKLFTFLPLSQIDNVMDKHTKDPGKRVAQRLLADDVTLRVHGSRATQLAVTATATLFSPGIVSGVDEFLEALGNMPERRVSRSGLTRGLAIIDLLVASGLARSKAEARRGILHRGFYLNNQPIEKVDFRVTEQLIKGPPGNRFVILRKGKKNYVRLVLEP